MFGIGMALAMLIWIGLLPRIFFRPGRRNFQWWLNAIPFWVAGATLIGVAWGVFVPWRPAHALPALAMSLASIGGSASAILLLRRTIAIHRRPLSLWHQSDDVPEHLVVDGPYAHVRHPFYTSFVIALGSSFLAAPHILTAFALVVGAYRLRRTALAEEARFRASGFGDAYVEYMRRTGRFLPKLSGSVGAASGRGVRTSSRPESAEASPSEPEPPR